MALFLQSIKRLQNNVEGGRKQSDLVPFKFRCFISALNGEKLTRYSGDTDGKGPLFVVIDPDISNGSIPTRAV